MVLVSMPPNSSNVNRLKLQEFIARELASTKPLLHAMASPNATYARRECQGKQANNNNNNGSSRSPSPNNNAGSRDDVNTGNRLLPHQQVLQLMARLRAQGKIATPGLLAVHSTGAGKTASGVATMLEFWNNTVPGTSDPLPIILVSTASNQSSNNVDELAANAIRFFGAFRSTLAGFPDYPFRALPGESYKKQLKRASTAITKRLVRGLRAIPRARWKKDDARDMYTFIKLGNDILQRKIPQQGLEHCVLIVDEIQMLLSPSSSEASQKRQYSAVKSLLLGRDSKTSWVLGMTATPGETKEELVQVLNFVLGNERGVTVADLANRQAFRRKAAGVVSYCYLLGDYMHFPKLAFAAPCFNIRENAWYGDPYFSALGKLSDYKNLLKSGSKNGKNAKGVSLKPGELEYNANAKRSYMRTLRKLGTYIPYSGNTRRGNNNNLNNNNNNNNNVGGNWNGNNADRLPIARFATARGSQLSYLLSPKILYLLDFIHRNDGKHYVYTSNPTTVRLIAWALKKWLGMEQFRGLETNGPPNPHRRYFVMIDNIAESKLAGLQGVGYQRASQAQKRVAYARAVAKGDKKRPLKADVDGNRVRVVLATAESYKGIDIGHLRYLHLLDPLVDFQDYIQFVGRGTRACSHSGMPEPKVQVMVYRLTDSRQRCGAPSDPRLFADYQVWSESLERYRRNWKVTQELVRDVAVDKHLFEDNLHRNMREIEEAVETMPKCDCRVPDLSNFYGLSRNAHKAVKTAGRKASEYNANMARKKAIYDERKQQYAQNHARGLHAWKPKAHYNTLFNTHKNQPPKKWGFPRAPSEEELKRKKMTREQWLASKRLTENDLKRIHPNVANRRLAHYQTKANDATRAQYKATAQAAAAVGAALRLPPAAQHLGNRLGVTKGHLALANYPLKRKKNGNEKNERTPRQKLANLQAWLQRPSVQQRAREATKKIVREEAKKHEKKLKLAQLAENRRKHNAKLREEQALRKKFANLNEKKAEREAGKELRAAKAELRALGLPVKKDMNLQQVRNAINAHKRRLAEGYDPQKEAANATRRKGWEHVFRRLGLQPLPSANSMARAYFEIASAASPRNALRAARRLNAARANKNKTNKNARNSPAPNSGAARTPAVAGNSAARRTANRRVNNNKNVGNRSPNRAGGSSGRAAT